VSRRVEELDWQQTPMGEISLRRRREPTLDVDVFEVRLGEEHDAHEWVDVPTALSRLPFRGLKETVRRAARALG